MVGSKHATMADRRALLTDREREIISGEADVSDSYRYQTISRVRSRFDRLEGDLEAFREHGDLFTELRKLVCEDAQTGDIAEHDSSETVPATNDSPTEPSSGEDTHREPQADTVSALTEDQRDRLAENLTGSGDLLEARIDAIEKMYQELQRLGEATSDELLDVIDPETVRFTGGKKTSPEESSWSNLVKGKDTLSSLPGVEKPPTGNSTWRYKGEKA